MTVADFQPVSDGMCGEDDFVGVVWCFTFSDPLYSLFYCLIIPYQSDPCAAFQSDFIFTSQQLLCYHQVVLVLCTLCFLHYDI